MSYFHHEREIKYSLLESAKLLCQYADLVERAKSNPDFAAWYSIQTSEDLELMKRDQTARTMKQVGKVAGKIALNVATAAIGFVGWSGSPTKEIAESSIYSSIWFALVIRGIRYTELRKLK